MPERSKRIILHDEEKVKQINPETLKLMQKVQGGYVSARIIS